MKRFHVFAVGREAGYTDIFDAEDAAEELLDYDTNAAEVIIFDAFESTVAREMIKTE